MQALGAVVTLLQFKAISLALGLLPQHVVLHLQQVAVAAEFGEAAQSVKAVAAGAAGALTLLPPTHCVVTVVDAFSVLRLGHQLPLGALFELDGGFWLKLAAARGHCPFCAARC